jgi:hypothetical protein
VRDPGVNEFTSEPRLPFAMVSAQTRPACNHHGDETLCNDFESAPDEASAGFLSCPATNAWLHG